MKPGVAAGIGGLLTKCLEPSSRTIVYDGRDITAERPAGIARRGIVRLFQTMAVFPHLSVHDNVREILDTAPARFLKFVSYKAAEAGAIYLQAPTRKLKPSQTCPACGCIRKKTLRERIHQCGDCGHTEPRDAAAARVCLIWARKQIDSREPADAA